MTEKPGGKVTEMGRMIQGVWRWDFHSSDDQSAIENDEAVSQLKDHT